MEVRKTERHIKEGKKSFIKGCGGKWNIQDREVRRGLLGARTQGRGCRRGAGR